MKSLRSLIPENVKKYFRILRSVLAAIRYGFPARKLKLIGVTGTSGKSTTANMIYHILDANDYEVGLVSTVGVKAGRKSLDTGLHVTTPDPIQFQQILSFLVKRRVEYAIIESSSHALAQGRLGLVRFEDAVFTNIKRDHLDWHGTWENYATAKAILAKKTKKEGKIILNRDDKDKYSFMADLLGSERFAESVITYSMNEIVDLDERIDGVDFTLNGNKYTMPVLGTYNVQNALAAINICLVLGLTTEQIAKGLESFRGIEGRMQVMKNSPFVVIVDFAHNADSLEKSLQSVKKVTGFKGRVITVFGSAGLRDVEKRSTMGRVSAENADITVITAEDPRTEKLYDINSEIIKGAEEGGGKLIKRFENTKDYKNYAVEVLMVNKGSVYAFDEESVDSRYDAVEFAIKIAKPGDVIITEGKGHEQSLCFGKTEYPFTDQDAVKRALKNLGYEDEKTSEDND